jgi:aryl-alcohol dehydrogenase-like predicted oxidoreductase
MEDTLRTVFISNPPDSSSQVLTSATENTFACMKAAYDVGINFFDCAEGYANGESERVMGEAIKKFGWKRSDLVVSTKVRVTRHPPPRLCAQMHLQGLGIGFC